MRALVTVLACLLLAGCSGVEIKRGDKSAARREVNHGPGMLSGSKGEFVIFRQEGAPLLDERPTSKKRAEAEEEPSDSE